MFGRFAFCNFGQMQSNSLIVESKIVERLSVDQGFLFNKQIQNGTEAMRFCISETAGYVMPLFHLKIETSDQYDFGSKLFFTSFQFRSTTDWRRSWEAHNCLLHISMSWDQIRKPDTNNLLISQLLKLYVCVFEGFLMRLLWRLPTFFASYWCAWVLWRHSQNLQQSLC